VEGVWYKRENVTELHNEGRDGVHLAPNIVTVIK